MTDAELIGLLDSKFPQELSAEEVAALRTRLNESPDVREALRERLLMDQSLTQVLGEIQLDPAVVLCTTNVRRSRGGQTIAALVTGDRVVDRRWLRREDVGDRSRANSAAGFGRRQETRAASDA
ncbi:MAG: hypothetical protein QM811_13700 [Pirellulales bacterium]